MEYIRDHVGRTVNRWVTVRTLEWESALPSDSCAMDKHDAATPSAKLCPYVAYCRKCSAVAYERKTIVKRSE